MILLLSAAVCAQWKDDQTSRLGIGISFYMPGDSVLSTSIGSAWFGPNLSYNLKFDEQARAVSVMNLGFYGKEQKTNKGTLIPLTYSAIKHFGKDQSNWYTGGGVGAYFVKLDEIAGTSAKQKFGFHAIGGREFGNGAFAEVRYDLIPRWGDRIGLSGLTVSAGIHQSF
jgi:hypothetical protein